jgi:hypothetical protein
MVALAAARNTPRLGEAPHPSQFTLGMAAATTVFGGGMVCQNAGGFAVPASATAGLSRVIGIAEETTANAGANGDVQVVLSHGAYRFANSAGVDAINDTHRFRECYAADDQTVALTNAGGRPVAGIVWDVDALGVWVIIQPTASAAAGGGGGAGPGIDYKLSAVMTSTGALPAYTRTGNRIQANANGALGAQDGVTPTAGMRYLFRHGAAGADNGLYSVTQVGDAMTPFILDRAEDADASSEVTSGMLVFVTQGTANANKWYFLDTDDPITLNTTALSFTELPRFSDVQSADASLTTRVSTEESTRASADTSLTTRVSAEESNRTSGDLSLTTRVSTEESTRASADTSLTNRVSTEESTRASADTSLTNRVSTEESTRASADTSLTNRVSTEESTRASADTSLTTRVSAEESNRTSGDLSLTTRVSTEESTRASADTSLTNRVSTEESTRASADTSLTNRVSTEESTRLSADNSLDARLDTHGNAEVLFSLYDLREVDANGDVGNIAANGGLLASDTTPFLEGNANEDQQVVWAVANVDVVCAHTTLPRDFRSAGTDVTCRLIVSSGATDATSFTIRTNWDGGAQVVDSGTGSASATAHEIAITIASGDIPASPKRLTLQIEPNAHANNTFTLHGFRIEYTSTAGN